MAVLTAVTANLLIDLSRWKERRQVLVDGLRHVKPDILAMQEAHLKAGTAEWTAEQLGLEHVYISPKTGKEGRQEGIAIASRLPFTDQATLDLGSQGRVAQQVTLETGNGLLVFVNGHFYWQPGESAERDQQVHRLLGWVSGKMQQAVVVCGDYNSMPEMQSIRLMKRQFRSAYEQVHGREPAYTYPTPLPRSKLLLLKVLLRYAGTLRLSDIGRPVQGTLDYIFTNHKVQVEDCELILRDPSPENPKIFASDHYGLAAKIRIGT